MKTKFFILFLLAFVALSAAAGPVSRQRALKKAAAFLGGSEALQPTLQSSAENATYYVFSAPKSTKSPGRFVVVSGETGTVEVLAYGDGAITQEADMPEAMRQMLRDYDAQISLIRQGARAARQLEAEAIEPLMTTKWGQREPYYYKTPNWGQVTGCVATAMAQVLKYWSQNVETPGIPAYNGIDSLPPITFDYAAMRDEYKEGSYTWEEGQPVATLMRYCGQAVKMAYGDTESSASLFPDVMARYFAMDASAKSIRRSHYSTAQWDAIIYDELAARRPVLYSGRSSSVGHQFVVDGFDGQGRFHINWGWDGGSDGYFLLNLCDPDSKGTGGGTGSDGFSSAQSAMVGVQPSKGTPLSAYDRLTATQLKTTTLMLGRSNAAQNFMANVYYSVCNTNSIGNTFDLGLGLFNEGGELLTTLWKISNRTFSSAYAYYWPSLNLNFGANLPDGNYTIVPISRKAGESEWLKDFDAEFYSMDCRIEGNTLYLLSHETDGPCQVKILSTEGLMKANKPVRVNLIATNMGTQHASVLYLKTNGKVVGQGTAYFENGESQNLTLSFTPDLAGTYVLDVVGNYDASTVLATTTIEIGEPTAIDLTFNGNTIKNRDGNNIIGTDFHITYSLTANQEFADNLYFYLFIYKNDGKATLVASETRETHIPAGETAEISFSVANCEVGYRHSAALYTYSSFFNQIEQSEWLYIQPYPDGIGTITTLPATAGQRAYGIDGRAVKPGTTLRPGVYIIDGKKRIIK